MTTGAKYGHAQSTSTASLIAPRHLNRQLINAKPIQESREEQ